MPLYFPWMMTQNVKRTNLDIFVEVRIHDDHQFQCLLVGDRLRLFRHNLRTVFFPFVVTDIIQERINYIVPKYNLILGH